MPKIKKRKRNNGEIKILSRSLDTLEDWLNSIKKNPRFKDGLEYVDGFLEEIYKSRYELEGKIEEMMKKEKKRFTHHFVNLEKFLNRINK